MKVGSIRRGAVAGVIAVAVWTAAIPLDQRLVQSVTGKQGYNDVALLGMFFTRGPAWRPMGAVLHLLVGAVFGAVFGSVAARRLPGPLWLRALLTAEIENAAFVPLTPLVDRLHPAVQAGRTGRTATPRALLQALWRHTLFGLVLGFGYERLP